MGRYDKYICTTLQKRHMLPGPTPTQRDELAKEGLRISMEHVLWVDSDIIPGAYYGESTWIWPRSYPGQITDDELAKRTTTGKPMFPHAHGFPEILSWWSGDPDHPEDTSAMSMIMDYEEIPLNTSWIAYIPAGMIHMPKMTPGARVTGQPVCHWTFGPGAYTRDKNNEEAKDERTEAMSDHVIVPGKNTNLRYFVQGGQQTEQHRPYYIPDLDAKSVRPVAFIDETVIPDAELGCFALHIRPTNTAIDLCIMNSHTLPHGSYFTVTAMNYDDITDLAAEAELYIGGEKHMITKSFGAYIPPGLECGPLTIRNTSKQLFFVIAYPIGEGVKKYPGY